MNAETCKSESLEVGSVQIKRVFEKGFGDLEIFPISVSQDTLVSMLMDIFKNYWKEIHFGVLIQGLVLEIAPEKAPNKLAVLDGYLTVEFGSWHIHVCVGEHTGCRCQPATAEVVKMRCPAHAELYRKLNKEGQPTFWGFRIYNGLGEQTMHIFLPNPLLTEKMDHAVKPDWTRLHLWDHLRKQYLGLDADPKDRLAKRFCHD